MLDLDSVDEIAKKDPGQIHGSIVNLGDQVKQVWEETRELEIPDSYKSIENVVVAGMGGSGLGARVIKALFNSRLRVPVELSTEFTLPEYVNGKTLVILSSYSGNTDETLSSLYNAHSKMGKVVGITCGGKLAEELQKANDPVVLIDPVNNPAQMPRMGIGYSIGAIMAILVKVGVLDIREEEINAIVMACKGFSERFGVRTHTRENPAKSLAIKIQSQVPVLVSSEHLAGVSHAFRNHLHENAKTFAVSFVIPELNHHLMEGLKFPSKIRGTLHFLFIESDLYSADVKKRYPLTADVVSKNGFGYDVYKLSSDTKIAQAFEYLVFELFVGFYLAILHGINPSPIPWVDYFKEKLT